MRVTSTVTSKGQITIPAEVRRALRLKPGSRVAFVPTPTGSYEFTVSAPSLVALRGIVRSTHPVTLDQMDDAIAAGALQLGQ